MRKNWKTTLFGALAGAPQFLQAFGLVSNPRAVLIANLLSAIGVLGLGFSAKDSNVTGGTVQQ